MAIVRLLTHTTRALPGRLGYEPPGPCKHTVRSIVAPAHKPEHEAMVHAAMVAVVLFDWSSTCGVQPTTPAPKTFSMPW